MSIERKHYINPDELTVEEARDIYIRREFKRLNGEIADLEGAIGRLRIAHAEELAGERAAHAGQLASLRTKLVTSEARERHAERERQAAETLASNRLQRLRDAHALLGDGLEVDDAASAIEAVPVRPLQRTTVRETTREIVEEEVPSVGDIAARARRSQPGARGFSFLRREMDEEDADVVRRIGGGDRRTPGEIVRESLELLGHMVAGTRPAAGRA